MSRRRRAALALLVLVSIGAGAALALVALRPDSPTRAHEGRRVPFLERVEAAGVIEHYRVSRRTRLPRLLDVHLLPRLGVSEGAGDLPQRLQRVQRGPHRGGLP